MPRFTTFLAIVTLVLSLGTASGCGKDDADAVSASETAPASKLSTATFTIERPPKGWCEKWSVTLLAPDGHANVIASSEPLDQTIDSKEYAEVQGDLLRKEFPKYKERSFEKGKVAGVTRYEREFQWTPPDGVPITQFQTYAAIHGTGYTATATAPSDDFDKRADQLIHLARSVRPQTTDNPRKSDCGDQGGSYQANAEGEPVDVIVS